MAEAHTAPISNLDPFSDEFLSEPHRFHELLREAGPVYCFARNPDQWSLLREDLSLARGAFEEVIRYEGPIQTFFRTTTKSIDVAGVQIPQGEKVLLFLAAANRDSRKWEHAERFDIRRQALGHVGFGNGIHGCVGQAVARMEGEIVLTALAKRVEAIELSGEPRLLLNNTLRGWASLPVTARRAAH